MLRENQCGSVRAVVVLTRCSLSGSWQTKAREFRTSIYLAFVDLRKAHDSMNREALWAVLQGRYLLPEKLIKILRVLHQGTKGAVRGYGKVSKGFDITTGVRQGDVLAPDMFNLFFDAVIEATSAEHPRSGVMMLYNLGNEMVGSRKKMRGGVSHS